MQTPLSLARYGTVTILPDATLAYLDTHSCHPSPHPAPSQIE
jgi:hypothetical protein